MNSIVKFPTPPKPESQEELPVNLDDPLVQALLAEVDELVSFDINTADIEELRLNTRLALVHAHHDFVRCKSILRLLHGILKSHRSSELKKYLASNKSDEIAAAKALAFNRAVCLIPRNFQSCLEIQGR